MFLGKALSDYDDVDFGNALNDLIGREFDDLANRLADEEDGLLWAMEVEDYQRFGVIVTGEDGSMTKIVEKPSEPISKLANIGVYYIKDWKLLFDWTNRTIGAGWLRSL